jgi:DNA repair protein RadC
MSDVASTLESIKGIGPATRTAVLDAFPTLSSIDKATLAQVEAVKGVGPATAKAIKAAVTNAGKSTAGTRAKTATKSASTTVKKTSVKDVAGDVADGTKAELHDAKSKVIHQADNAQAQVKAALTSIQNIASSALDAGKESYPEAQKQIKAAMASIRKVGPALADALGKLRD